MIKNKMSVIELKDKMEELKGKSVDMKVNRGRNKIEYFPGKIMILYPSVFTVSNENKNNKLETFSYNDVLCSKVIFSKSENE